jgi:hypothetical protein
MRAINVQVSRRLVEFVLDRIGRHDLDVSVDESGRIAARFNAVPRVRLKEQSEQLV